MLGIDTEIGNSALRLWVAAGSAALLVFICALAFDWTRTRSMVRISVVGFGVIFGAALAWAFLTAASVRDQNAERLSLEMRAAQLTTQTLAPGSPLACLDGLAGDGVETACEKALFAGPAIVAAATSYVAVRFALLADMVAYSNRGGATIDNILSPLRHSLESDRFGFVAHMLAARDGCNSEKCQALGLLPDASRVRANLKGGAFDRYLDHYLAVWQQAPDGAAAAAVGPSAGLGPPAAGHKAILDGDFPSAASIPPVSIMNPEPKGPMAAAANAGDKPASAAALASRHGRKPSGPPPAQAAVSSPAPEAPDPVWSPGTVPAAPRAAAAAPAAATGGAAPVQLNPFAAAPEASTGAAPRAQ
jgi:hypothetical protein